MEGGSSIQGSSVFEETDDDLEKEGKKNTKKKKGDKKEPQKGQKTNLWSLLGLKVKEKEKSN